ncbi:MAG: hypothetical protein E6J69_12170 [Deltaproteobacteria bacterium]|nr:MAG: hypothetical protein E6J69_12170 [Deltaproteobacteria bacterium]
MADEPTAQPAFGTSVAALGSNVLISAPSATIHRETGAVYLLDGTTGGLLHTFSNPTPWVGDPMGASVTTVGGNVVVGAPFDDQAAVNAGAAYVFHVDACSPPGDPCDDGSACTTDDVCTSAGCFGTPVSCASCEACDQTAGCVPTPQPGCLASSTASLKLAVGGAAHVGEDLLTWRWRDGRGSVSTACDYCAVWDGDPTQTDYVLCLYDGAGGAVVAHAPAGGVCADRPCWKQLPRLTGFKYIDRERTPDGLAYMRLFSGTGPERGPTITVKGGGPNLRLPPLPLALPARLQLQQTNGDCWEATYATDGVLRNDATEFQGKAAVP